MKNILSLSLVFQMDPPPSPLQPSVYSLADEGRRPKNHPLTFLHFRLSEVRKAPAVRFPQEEKGTTVTVWHFRRKLDVKAQISAVKA